MAVVHRPRVALPFAVACVGIALFSGMDAVMKGVTLAVGAYDAMFWRALIGIGLSVLPWWASRRRWPRREALRLHVERGLVGSIMAVAFFYGIARIPLAEGIAISFIAPLLALYLAAALLGEVVGRHTIAASLFGLGGVGVIVVARWWTGTPGERHLDGVAAILVPAVLYAWNIVLMRRQALVAAPVEVAFFQNVTTAAWLGMAAPFFAIVPGIARAPMLVLAAMLAYASHYLLSWSYARAPANVLVPVEYTAFVWAAIMGAVFFSERVT
jgi:S-adenosylmethionine uptake transporter